MIRNPRAGDIVDAGRGWRRYWLVVKLTKTDIAKRQLNASEPGLYGVSGLWYPGGTATEQPYGKLTGPLRGRMRIVCHTRGALPRRKLLR